MNGFPSLTETEAAIYLRPSFTLEETSLKEFRSLILQFYEHHGRRFAWRQTSDPYRILLSEVMLQQTQTTRVQPKYELFLSLWPTFADLAARLMNCSIIGKGLGIIAGH